jgi:hypothetical protein
MSHNDHAGAGGDASMVKNFLIGAVEFYRAF